MVGNGLIYVAIVYCPMANMSSIFKTTCVLKNTWFISYVDVNVIRFNI